MSYKDAFQGRTPAALEGITADESGGSVPGSIDFGKHDNPDISVDTSGRFVTHEIIGGVSVRQKLGEDPVEIGVRGVCNGETAGKIDQLRNAKSANFISDRISMTVHVASTSTQPLEQGGAADADTGELLYTYRMNLVGIEDVSSG